MAGVAKTVSLELRSFLKRLFEVLAKGVAQEHAQTCTYPSYQSMSVVVIRKYLETRTTEKFCVIA